MRIALIGCGMIGQLRAAAIARIPHAEFRLVCDLDQKRTVATSKKYHCSWETDWTKAVTRADVDMVIVSTPNNSHAEIALAAIEAGKHVLCEKPLGRTLEECQRMVTSASQRGVKLMTGFNLRRYPPFYMAKTLLDSGVIGQPLSLRGWMGHEAGPEFGRKWMAQAGVAGGGTLMDNGVHLIDLVRFLVGEITQVQAHVQRPYEELSSPEHQALAILQAQRGAAVFIMSSWTEWRGYHVWLQVHGTEGAITAQYPPMLTLLDMKEPGRQRARRKHFLFLKDHLVERIRGYRWTLTRSLAQDIEELIAAIKENRAPRPDGYDGMRAVEVVEAIHESSKRGCQITLSVLERRDTGNLRQQACKQNPPKSN